jgi:GNAT superfamily N-acetyltransferase
MIPAMEREKFVHYVPPEKSEMNELFRHHKFEVNEDGVVISSAEVQYYTRPIPVYQVTDLYTIPSRQNEGFASAVLDKIEAFLIERGKPGILVDGIMSDVPELTSMYERRGWRLIDQFGRRVFNLAPDVDPGIFIGYEVRGAEVESNEKWEENRKSFFSGS